MCSKTNITNGIVVLLIIQAVATQDSITNINDTQEENITETNLQNITNTFNSTDNIIEHKLVENEMPLAGEQNISEFDNLTELDLSNTSLNVLTPELFLNSTSLTKLNLSHNNIRVLNNNTFRGLTNLQELNLAYNYIATIDEEAFSGLRIQKLYLQTNSINFLGSIFNSLRTLRILDLENNNITTLFGSEFSHLSFLSHLNLAGNGIKILKLKFNSFARLQNLWLHHNFIEYLDKTSLTGITSLDNLDLHNNLIKEIEPRSIYEIDLQTVNLSFNYLKSLDSEQIKTRISFKFLNVSFNTIRKVNFTDLFTVRKIDFSNNEICVFSVSTIWFNYLNLKKNYLTCSEEAKIKDKNVGFFDDFIGSDRCNPTSSENEREDSDFQNICSTFEINDVNNNILITVITCCISFPVIIVMLYCGFVKKVVFCKSRNEWEPQIGNNHLVEAIDSVLQVISLVGHGDNNNDPDEGDGGD